MTRSLDPRIVEIDRQILRAEGDELRKLRFSRRKIVSSLRAQKRRARQVSR
jgi:hypothetical protein